MKKNGFTLIELISVIVILSIIIMLIIPTIINNISDKKGEAYQKNIDIILSAARGYVIDYDIETPTSISLDELCGIYFECPIINPKDNEEIEGYVVVDEERNYYFINGLITLEVDLNGGSTSQEFDETYLPYTKIDLKDPIRDTYTFDKWIVVRGNSIIKDSNLTIGTEDTTITANWSATSQTLTVKLNGGTTSQSFKGTYKTNEVITLTNPTRTGYTFIGWSVTSGNSILSGNTLTMGSQNTTITANWKASTYTLSFNSNGGSAVGSKTITYGETYGTLPTPTRAGYEFLGWYAYNYKDNPLNYYADTYADLKNAFGYNADLLYAHWKANGINEGRRISQYISSDKVTTASNITVYAGWRANTTIPVFTYTGNCEIVDDSDNVISNTSTCGKSISNTQSTWTGNWKIRFLTSGTLTFTTLNGASNGIDVFLVGGGAGGAAYWDGGAIAGAGGGGYTKTFKGNIVSPMTSYTIVIGAGGRAGSEETNVNSSDGNPSSAFGYTASGGKTAGGGGYGVGISKGGNGGSGGGSGKPNPKSGGSHGNYGSGGIDGSNGSGSWPGTGQGTTTREFGEAGGNLYSSGGSCPSSASGPDNSGNGGGGCGGLCTARAGGSGIVIIRNKR